MGVLDRILGRNSKSSGQTSGGAATSTASRADAANCPHVALTPRWDSAADIGHEDRATSFVCDSCQQSLTPAAAQEARASAAARLRHDA